MNSQNEQPTTEQPQATALDQWHARQASRMGLPIPETAALVEALAAAEAEFAPLIADAVNPHFGSRYATLGALITATRPALSRHGLVVIQTLENGPHGVELVTTLRHSSGQAIASRFPLPPWKGPQDLGSLLTYLRRYCEGAILNLATEADDDGNTAEHAPRAAAAAEGRRQGRFKADAARRGNASPRAAQREREPIQERHETVNPGPLADPAQVAADLADAIDVTANLAQLDALVPSLAQLPADLRPPLRKRFSDRRAQLHDIARDIAELDALDDLVAHLPGGDNP